MTSPVRSAGRWVRRRCLQPALVGLAGPFSAALARLVSGNDASAAFARHGLILLLRKHYYVPIPDKADFEVTDRLGLSELVGVDLNEAGALKMLDGVFPPYLEEFRRRWPAADTVGAGADEFHLINGAFMAVDAHVYYTFIRHFKPRRVVEIGSGFSTRVAAEACLKNQAEGSECRLTSVEPYPGPLLKKGFPGLTEVLESRVQDVDMKTFTSLRSGDILFIDSTHALREGGDVQLEYCEILPRLAPGVLVHVHDISLPKGYPPTYRSQHLYWNEQYLLQAFLTFNSRFEVLWAGNALMVAHPERLNETFAEIALMRRRYPQSEPSSFWMRVRGEA